MPQVGAPRLRHRVVVPVDDLTREAGGSLAARNRLWELEPKGKLRPPPRKQKRNTGKGTEAPKNSNWRGSFGVTFNKPKTGTWKKLVSNNRPHKESFKVHLSATFWETRTWPCVALAAQAGSSSSASLGFYQNKYALGVYQKHVLVLYVFFKTTKKQQHPVPWSSKSGENSPGLPFRGPWGHCPGWRSDDSSHQPPLAHIAGLGGSSRELSCCFVGSSCAREQESYPWLISQVWEAHGLVPPCSGSW